MRSLKSIPAALAATALAAMSLAAQAPTTGWRAENLSQLASLEKKYEQLADVTPWDKYSFKPGKDAKVRSTCEVFLHIAGDNYMMAEPLGAKKPANIDYKTVEKCPDSKAKVVATMKAGFDHVRAAILATPDADADKMVEIFGEKMTKRALLGLITEHMGEHLGQSIAYARSNNIVPPWSMKGAM